MHTAFRELSFLTVTVAWLSQIMNAIIAGSKIYVSELTFISCSAVKQLGGWSSGGFTICSRCVSFSALVRLSVRHSVARPMRIWTGSEKLCVSIPQQDTSTSV